MRRALAMEALVIVGPGRFTPADVGIVLALRRQHRLVVRVRRADAGRRSLWPGVTSQRADAPIAIDSGRFRAASCPCVLLLPDRE